VDCILRKRVCVFLPNVSSPKSEKLPEPQQLPAPSHSPGGEIDDSFLATNTKWPYIGADSNLHLEVNSQVPQHEDNRTNKDSEASESESNFEVVLADDPSFSENSSHSSGSIEPSTTEAEEFLDESFIEDISLPNASRTTFSGNSGEMRDFNDDNASETSALHDKASKLLAEAFHRAREWAASTILAGQMITVGIRSCANADCQDSSSASGDQQNGSVLSNPSSSSFGNRSKRPRPRSSDSLPDDDDEEDDDEQRNRKRQNGKQQPSEQKDQRRLACPYYQRRPMEHERGSCSGPGFTDMGRVK
jgi:hypothetical protein